MPRPIKRRTICAEPKIKVYGPLENNSNLNVYMNLEEYETIRLIDYEGLTQEECSKLMGVARTTVQKIYDDVRHKVADAFINGKNIKIEGGNYTICNDAVSCNRIRCRRLRSGQNRK